MSERPRTRVSDELRPYVNAEEAAQIDRLGERLLTQRSAIRRGFRVQLRERLFAMGKQATPRGIGRLRLRTAALAYVGAGVALIGFAALGLTGMGPLTP